MSKSKIHIDDEVTSRVFGRARLTGAMWKALKVAAAGRYCIDLGCGECAELAQALATEAKPSIMVAIDCRLHPVTANIASSVLLPLRHYLNQLEPRDAGLAIMSWPANTSDYVRGALPHIAQAKRVALIGIETGGLVIGTGAMWQSMLSRKLEMVIRSSVSKQFIAFYGPALNVPVGRGRYQEERAGVTGDLIHWLPETM